ncbi:hypothetical protein OHS58_03795 [Amycolatopsis sp. NBC_00348]|uniref:hypothetical protein n=1 Tax=Amycolatopsis sp. NBC_00348 TaxID=2975956 RepID=UPI002E25C6A7
MQEENPLVDKHGLDEEGSQPNVPFDDKKYRSGNSRIDASARRFWGVDRASWLNVLFVLIAAALTGGVALWGSYIGASGAREAALEQQKLSISASIDAEIRAKRSEIYTEYLKTADNYSIKNGVYLAHVKARAAAGIRGAESTDMPGPLKDWVDSRSAYQDSVNLVSIYGSKAAWEAHKVMASVLPASVERVEIVDVDSAKFIAAYRNFLRVACQELNPKDNKGCY